MSGKDRMTCQECGHAMVRGTRPMEFQYKGRKVTLEQPGYYCEGCAEGLHTGADIAATEAAFLRFKADVDGIVSPAETARIRKKLGLSQRRAGMMLGGGENAFQRYEAGKDLPTRAMSNLLRLLDRDPSRLKELAPTDNENVHVDGRSMRRRRHRDAA